MRKLGKIALKFIVFNTERRKMNILLENHAADGENTLGKIHTRRNSYGQETWKNALSQWLWKKGELEWHAVHSGRIVRRFQRNGSLGADKSVKKQLLSHTSSENANEGNMKNVGK